MLALAAPDKSAQAQPKAKASWAQPQIVRVAKAGLIGADAKQFRPDDDLTGAELEELVAGLEPRGAAGGSASHSDRGRPRRQARSRARPAGRRLPVLPRGPRCRAEPAEALRHRVGGTTIGLRFNHPAGTDDLELQPDDPVTRAETAFSAARMLELSDWETERVDELSRVFALPTLGDWQRHVLSTAVGLIGRPYVWGGTETGFDCSGFVWRVVKLTPYAGAATLPNVLRGRTTFR